MYPSLKDTEVEYVQDLKQHISYTKARNFDDFRVENDGLLTN